MMLKQSNGSYWSPLPRKPSSPVPPIDVLPPARSDKILSQRMANGPAATKRLNTIETSRRSHYGKGSRLAFSKNLFREARKVDTRNPRESFLPQESHLKPDNSTKIKILLSAYSKLHGRPREGSSLQKPSKLDRLSKIDQIGEQVCKPSPFCQPPLSSLTRLILNECNPLLRENVGQAQIVDSSLHDVLQEEQYAQWINILCASTITPKDWQEEEEADLIQNPYGFPKKKGSGGKKQVRVKTSESQYFLHA